MGPHSSTLAWKIPWMEEPGGLKSMETLRVGHDWATSLALFTFILEKEMATHSSVLAWRIPGTGEPGGLPSMESHRVRHDWSDLAAAAAVSCRPLLLDCYNFLVLLSKIKYNTVSLLDKCWECIALHFVKVQNCALWTVLWGCHSISEIWKHVRALKLI